MQWIGKIGSFFHKSKQQTLLSVVSSFFTLHPLVKVKPVMGLAFCFLREALGGNVLLHSREMQVFRTLLEKYMTPEELAESEVPSESGSECVNGKNGDSEKIASILESFRKLSLEDPNLWKAFSGESMEVRMDLLDLLGNLLMLPNQKLPERAEELIRRSGRNLNLPSQQAERCFKAVLRHHNGPEQPMRSATGLAIALIVLLIFILAAVYLKSVFFGFLLAYLFLPLAKWYKKYVLETKVFRKIMLALGYVFSPLFKLKNMLWKQAGFPEEKRGIEQKAAARREALAARSAGLTVVSFLIGL